MWNVPVITNNTNNVSVSINNSVVSNSSLVAGYPCPSFAYQSSSGTHPFMYSHGSSPYSSSSFSQTSACYDQPPTHSPNPPWPPPYEAVHPFYVKLLNKRIKKCRGCGSEFSRKTDGSPPDSPNNLIIAHEERWPFSDTQNVMRWSKI